MIRKIYLRNSYEKEIVAAVIIKIISLTYTFLQNAISDLCEETVLEKNIFLKFKLSTLF